MPARDDTWSPPAGEWFEMTNGDATVVTFQNRGSGKLTVQGTAGAVPPDDPEPGEIPNGWDYTRGKGEVMDLEEFFPGVTGVNRLYGYTDRAWPTTVKVSHA